MTAVLTASPVIPDEGGRTPTNNAFFSHSRRRALRTINPVKKYAQKAAKRG
jgi:hypothetical protein